MARQCEEGGKRPWMRRCREHGEIGQADRKGRCRQDRSIPPRPADPPLGPGRNDRVGQGVPDHAGEIDGTGHPGRQPQYIRVEKQEKERATLPNEQKSEIATAIGQLPPRFHGRGIQDAGVLWSAWHWLCLPPRSGRHACSAWLWPAPAASCSDSMAGLDISHGPVRLGRSRLGPLSGRPLESGACRTQTTHTGLGISMRFCAHQRQALHQASRPHGRIEFLAQYEAKWFAAIKTSVVRRFSFERHPCADALMTKRLLPSLRRTAPACGPHPDQLASFGIHPFSSCTTQPSLPRFVRAVWQATASRQPDIMRAPVTELAVVSCTTFGYRHEGMWTGFLAQKGWRCRRV